MKGVSVLKKKILRLVMLSIFFLLPNSIAFASPVINATLTNEYGESYQVIVNSGNVFENYSSDGSINQVVNLDLSEDNIIPMQGGQYRSAWDSTGGLFAQTTVNLGTKSYQGTTLYKVNSVSGYWEFHDNTITVSSPYLLVKTNGPSDVGYANQSSVYYPANNFAIYPGFSNYATVTSLPEIGAYLELTISRSGEIWYLNLSNYR